MDSLKPYLAPIVSAFSGIPIGPAQVTFEDPKAKNAVLHRYTPGTLIFLGLVLVCAGLTMVATVADLAGFGSTQPKVLTWFSMMRNVRTLWSAASDPCLEVFNGVRVLAMCWVIVGHTFFFVPYVVPYNFAEFIGELFHGKFLGFIKAGTLSVDVFLFISGFFAALGLYRDFTAVQNRRFRNVLLAYFYRYVRLFPIFGFMLMYTLYMQPKLYDTPLNPLNENRAKDCETQWLPTLLFFNNFWSSFSGLCNGWVWYLFIDMQLFLLTPIVVIAYCYSKPKGLGLVLAICVGSVMVQIWTYVTHGLNWSFVKQNVGYDQNTNVYMKPQYRLVPYFAGVVMFFMYRDALWKSRICSWRMMRYLLYFVGGVLMVAVGYSFYYLDAYPTNWDRTFGITHMILSRPVFITGLGMILYPALFGKARVLATILGNVLFRPLARITYGAYMAHVPLLFLMTTKTVTTGMYSTTETIWKGLGMVVLSYVVAAILTLMLESPVVKAVKVAEKGKGGKEA